MTAVKSNFTTNTILNSTHEKNNTIEEPYCKTLQFTTTNNFDCYVWLVIVYYSFNGVY